MSQDLPHTGPAPKRQAVVDLGIVEAAHSDDQTEAIQTKEAELAEWADDLSKREELLAAKEEELMQLQQALKVDRGEIKKTMLDHTELLEDLEVRQSILQAREKDIDFLLQQVELRETAVSQFQRTLVLRQQALDQALAQAGSRAGRVPMGTQAASHTASAAAASTPTAGSVAMDDESGGGSVHSDP
jgi:uncharacterized protein (DUF3084 family)